MATEVGNVIFKISADIKELQGQLTVMQNSFASSFSKIEGLGKGLLGSLGVGLSVTGLVAFAKEVASVAGELEDLSNKTGISGKALSALKPIAEQNSSSIGDFANGITRLIRNLADGASAGDKARKTLQDMGFSFQQLSQFTAQPEKFIGEFAEKLAAIDNPAKRASVAFDVMGRSGANLIPTFLRIAELTKELGGFDQIKDKFGIPDETIRSLKQFDDSLNSIKNTLIRLAALPLADLARFLRAITGTGTAEDDIASLDKRIEALQKSAENQIARLPKSQQESFNTAHPQLTPDLQQTYDQIAALKKQRDALQGVQKAFSEVTPESDSATKKATEAAANFTEAIEKEIIKLQEQNIAFFNGADAAKAFALSQELALTKQKLLRQLQGEGVAPEIAQQAVAKAFAGIDPVTLAARLKVARDNFVDMATVASQNPDILKRLFESRELDELPGKIKAVIDRLAEAQATAPTGTLLALSIKAIGAELDKAQAQTKLFGDVFGIEFDSAEQQAGNLRAALNKMLTELRLPATDANVIKLKVELDQESAKAAEEEFTKRIAAAQEKLRLLGPNQVNIAQETASATSDELNRILLNPQAGPQREKLAQQLPGQRADAILETLRQARDEGSKLGEALGGYFDKVQDDINHTQQAIQDLIRAGIDPADARVKALQDQLGDLRAIDALQQGIEGLGDVMADVLTGQIKSWKDLGAAASKVINDIASEWIRAQIKMAINNSVNSSTSGGGFGVGSFFSSLFGLASAAAGGSSTSSAIPAAVSALEKVTVAEHHRGGMVGFGGYPMRSVDPSVFYHAKRYHDGTWSLGMDEVPIIAQKGETILPKGARVGMGPGGPTTIILNNPSFTDRRSSGQNLARIASAVKAGNRNL